MVEEDGLQTSLRDLEDSGEERWENLVQLDTPDASLMELESRSAYNSGSAVLTPPSSTGNQWVDIWSGTSNDPLPDSPSGNSSSMLVSTEHINSQSLGSPQVTTRSHRGIDEVTSPDESDITGSSQATVFGPVDPETEASEVIRVAFETLGPQYCTAISSISVKHRVTLIRFVQCIASTSAVLSLRLVLYNLRDLCLEQSGKHSATGIGAPRSSAERIAAIDDLSACMSHFALARLMHIYMFYKEAVGRTDQGADVVLRQDAFVLESGRTTPRERGNPLHNRKAAVTRNMMTSGQSTKRIGRLRRVGERLDILVSRFGCGILGVLDEELYPET